MFMGRVWGEPVNKRVFWDTLFCYWAVFMSTLPVKMSLVQDYTHVDGPCFLTVL